jgi:calcyclin binding protein
MESRKFEIIEDLKELKSHLEQCDRPSIRSVLIRELKNLDLEFRSLMPEEAEESSSIQYKSIEKWAWDQDDRYVRVYITTLPNLKSHPKEKVTLEYSSTSAMIAVHDVEGVNYKIKFPKLCHEIKSCRFSLKSNGFGLTMEKSEEKKNWGELEYKTPIFNRSEKDKKNKNVHEQFFDMMKSIYDNGDENMRESVGIPWMKAMAEFYRPITK